MVSIEKAVGPDGARDGRGVQRRRGTRPPSGPVEPFGEALEVGVGMDNGAPADPVAQLDQGAGDHDGFLTAASGLHVAAACRCDFGPGPRLPPLRSGRSSSSGRFTPSLCNSAAADVRQRISLSPFSCSCL